MKKCFVCKKRLVLTEQIKKEGRGPHGPWFLCWDCSAAYREKMQVKVSKEHWKGGVLCPKCESSNRRDDGMWPFRTVWCDDCGFSFNLWLYVEEGGATGLVSPPKRHLAFARPEK